MTWITVWIGIISLETGKWIPNLGAFLKALIMVVIGVVGLGYAARHGLANDLSFSNLLPTLDAGLFFLPVIVYNFMGFELMSGAAAEMKNPARDIPRAIFGKLHPVNKTPLSAYLITGVVSSVVLVIYGLMVGSAEDLFWTLFAFSSMVFLLPYLAMFPAFLKLRYKDPDLLRPYRVPVNNGVAALLVVLCELLILQAIVFFIWVPGEPVDWSYAGPVLIGVALTLVVGEVLLWVARRQKSS